LLSQSAEGRLAVSSALPFSGERADSDANIQLSPQSVHHDAAAVRNFHQLFEKLRVRAGGPDNLAREREPNPAIVPKKMVAPKMR
jgi:hypothetical protein